MDTFREAKLARQGPARFESITVANDDRVQARHSPARFANRMKEYVQTLHRDDSRNGDQIVFAGRIVGFEACGVDSAGHYVNRRSDASLKQKLARSTSHRQNQIE